MNIRVKSKQEVSGAEYGKLKEEPLLQNNVTLCCMVVQLVLLPYRIAYMPFLKSQKLKPAKYTLLTQYTLWRIICRF
jgi:hypothetical protein